MTSSMAEVSFLRLPETMDDIDDEDILAFDPIFPYCSHVYCTDDPNPISLTDHHHHIHNQADDFDLEPYNFSAFGSGSFEEVLECENQVTFVMDLLQQRVEQSRGLEIGSFELDPDPVVESGFGVVERTAEGIERDCLELEVGDVLGFGVEFDRNNKELGYGDDEEDDNFGGFIVSDCGDEFYVSRRESGNNSGGSSNGGRDEINRFSGGLNVVSFESEEEEELLETELHDDGNLALCWDALQLEDQRDVNEEFEWEEVGEGLEMLNPEESVSVSLLPMMGPEEDEVEERPRGGSGNVEWEVLLNVGNLERSLDVESNTEGTYFFGDHEDYIYTAEYEMTFGQFTEGEDAAMGGRPASKVAVESLGSVVMTEEDVKDGDVICAVCKDPMGVGEQAKQLPCSHRYHGECIVPWLGIRNSCPVCRHELPTDDPDYERRRTQRAARGQ